MAKKVEGKKKSTTDKKEEKKVVKEEIEEEKIDFEEFDDEELEERVKVVKDKPKKKKKKEDVLGDSLLKQNAEIINFFKILIGLLIFIGLFYFFLAFVRGELDSKKQNKEDEEEIRTIQNEEILATDIFNMEDKEYYVFIYDSSSKKASIYEGMYNDYKQYNYDVPMFYVDLNNKFNRDIVSTDTNKKAQKFNELEVSSPTLIHIKNGKNVDYYEDDKVIEQMVKLNK